MPPKKKAAKSKAKASAKAEAKVRVGINTFSVAPRKPVVDSTMAEVVKAADACLDILKNLEPGDASEVCAKTISAVESLKSRAAHLGRAEERKSA